MRLILDLEKYHRIGTHCLTTCLCTIFRYKGMNITEEMFLGLGSGLGFTYVRQPEGFIYGGRGGNLEQNLASVIGCRIISHKAEDSASAWEYNRKKLIEGCPLICDVDMAYLPYMIERLKTRGSGFSGHKLILIGFDDEKSEVYILDYLWSEKITISVEDFMKASGSSVKPMSPSNSAIYLDIPQELYPLKTSIIDAIDYNINQMKYPVGFGLGLKAMKRFFKELRLWPNVCSEDKLRYELNMASQVFEKVGTGGGNFRRMYSRFLKSANELYDSDLLQEASDIYAELGKKWKSMATVLHNASVDENIFECEIFSRSFELGNDIVALELQGIDILSRFVEREINVQNR